MSRTLRPRIAALALFTAACAGDPPDDPTLRLPGAVDPAFLLLGASPVAWAKEEGTRQAFERDARTCLDASTASRRAVTAEREAETAYTTFHHCMAEHGWSPSAYGPNVERIRPHETLDDRRTPE